MSYGNTNQKYASGGPASAPAVNTLDAPPMSALEEQVARLNESANDIAHLANRLHELGDRTFGPVPVSAGKEPAAPSPIHTLGKLSLAHEFMAAARARLRDAVDRLESL